MKTRQKNNHFKESLKKQTSKEARVTTSSEQGWLLEILAGEKGKYRLAQLDDYTNQARKDFTWRSPLKLSLSARVSAEDIPGTWGFGFWNDPFSFSLGLGGGIRRFPALPNTAWFFHASSENHLSFQENKPAQGFLAQTFQSPSIPPALLALGSPFVSLLALSWSARIIRPILGRFVKDDSVLIHTDVTKWHHYALQLERSLVGFKVDDCEIFQTSVVPMNPLGFVIWIDNQFASFPPNGKLTFGTMDSPQSAWLEVKDLQIIKE